MATNVPSITLTDQGWVVPSESAVLAGVQQDMNDAFGGNLNPALNTPQGQLATSTTAIIGNVNDNLVKQFNQVDPAYAAGRMQDAIGRIYFITRKPAQPTVVPCVCNGAASTPIPSGSLARATDGNTYQCIDGGVIGIDGTVTLNFACMVDGPIACPAGSLSQIYRAIPGWDSITNLVDGTLGNYVETRSEFEARRRASVAKNARGSLPSVQGAVLDISDVLDAYVTENTTSSPIIVRGVTIAAKSLYVAAVGGTDADVADAIWTKKAPGCGYNGNTTVTVYDTNGAYSPPLPSYDVSFQRPASLAILFAVNIANNAQVPSNATVLIQNAIIAAFAGADGGTRARIGSTIYASRFYSAVAALGSWAQIISIQVGSNNNTGASFTGSIAGSTLTVSGVTGAVAIGQTISDSLGGVPAGTRITAGSGTTWTINKTLTVSSRAMLSAVASRTSVDVNANQTPTINADNILVTLT